MSELDGLNANLQWIMKKQEEQERIMSDIFDRLRVIETELAKQQANRKPPMNGWAIFGVIATVSATILLILDRIYVNQ